MFSNNLHSAWVTVAAALIWSWAQPAPPTAPAAAEPLFGGGDRELRELLRARSDLEWFRLVACFLGVVAAFLLVAALALIGCLLGCCQSCYAAFVSRAGAGRAEAPLSPARRGDPNLLAFLVASEVRR